MHVQCEGRTAESIEELGRIIAQYMNDGWVVMFSGRFDNTEKFYALFSRVV